MGKTKRSKTTLAPDQDILSRVQELNLTEMHSEEPNGPPAPSDSQVKIKRLKSKYKPNSKKTLGDPAAATMDSLSVAEMDLDTQLAKALSRKPKIGARTSQSDTDQLWSIQSKMRDFLEVPADRSVSTKGMRKRGPSPPDDQFFNHSLRRSVSKVSSGNLAAIKAVATKPKRKKRNNNTNTEVTPRRRLKISRSKSGKRVKFSEQVIVFTVPADEERGSCDWRKNLTKEGLLAAMMWKSELLQAGIAN